MVFIEVSIPEDGLLIVGSIRYKICPGILLLLPALACGFHFPQNVNQFCN